MNSEFTLGQGAGQKLEFAVQRNDGTAEDIEYLSTGDNFRLVSLLRKWKIKCEDIEEISLLRTGKAKLVKLYAGGVGAIMPNRPAFYPWTTDTKGNIHLTLVSNGFTPEQWVTDIKSRGYRLTMYGEEALLRAVGSPGEAPTTAGTVYRVVIQPTRNVRDENRTPEKMDAHAARRGWTIPHWEVACLFRITFTDLELEQMGLWWVVFMHKPIVDSQGVLNLLHVHRSDAGRMLDIRYLKEGNAFDINGGVAYTESVKS